MRKNGIKHMTPAPYNPSSNGLAERAVKTFNEGLRKFKEVVEFAGFYIIIEGQSILPQVRLLQSQCSIGILEVLWKRLNPKAGKRKFWRKIVNLRSMNIKLMMQFLLRIMEKEIHGWKVR